MLPLRLPRRIYRRTQFLQLHPGRILPQRFHQCPVRVGPFARREQLLYPAGQSGDCGLVPHAGSAQGPQIAEYFFVGIRAQHSIGFLQGFLVLLAGQQRPNSALRRAQPFRSLRRRRAFADLNQHIREHPNLGELHYCRLQQSQGLGVLLAIHQAARTLHQLAGPGAVLSLLLGHLGQQCLGRRSGLRMIQVRRGELFCLLPLPLATQPLHLAHRFSERGFQSLRAATLFQPLFPFLQGGFARVVAEGVADESFRIVKGVFTE